MDGRRSELDIKLYRDKVTEATFKRLLKHLRADEEFVSLTAFRRGLRWTQVEEKNRQLMRTIVTDLNLPFIRIVAGFMPASTESDEESIRHECLFITGRNVGAKSNELASVVGPTYGQKSMLAGQVGIGLWLLLPDGSKQGLAHEVTSPTLLEAWASWISHNQMDGGEVRLEYLAYRPSTMAESLYWRHLLDQQGISQAIRDKFDRY